MIFKNGILRSFFNSTAKTADSFGSIGAISTRFGPSSAAASFGEAGGGRFGLFNGLRGFKNTSTGEPTFVKIGVNLEASTTAPWVKILTSTKGNVIPKFKAINGTLKLGGDKEEGILSSVHSFICCGLENINISLDDIDGKRVVTISVYRLLVLTGGKFKELYFDSANNNVAAELKKTCIINTSLYENRTFEIKDLRGTSHKESLTVLKFENMEIDGRLYNNNKSSEDPSIGVTTEKLQYVGRVVLGVSVNNENFVMKPLTRPVELTVNDAKKVLQDKFESDKSDGGTLIVIPSSTANGPACTLLKVKSGTNDATPILTFEGTVETFFSIVEMVPPVDC